LKNHHHTPDMTPPSPTETANRTGLGSKLAVAGALVSWFVIAWLAITALGPVAGVGLAVWGMPLVALSAIYRLDRRDVAAPAEPTTATATGASRAPASPAPQPAYAGAAAQQSTHAA
jgi:hypothetical protein